ncbi:hypothetical protein GCM10022404_01710 [Celeribacter arenosi]|uniref:Streptomycin 6-kinase n=2 Tax=Celeribacter arenosi TaxID=792649 RepID=A0ABP7JT74_9RHOB
MFRRGLPTQADTRLAQAMTRLHANSPTMPENDAFEPLDHYTRALKTFVPPANFSTRARSDIARAQSLLADLLTTQTPANTRLLHGDLHHDNVLGSDENWQIIDPKSVVGDLHFEPANAFRNPLGASPATFTAPNIHARAALWASALDLDKERLLKWAAAKCALSIAWTCGPQWDGKLPQNDIAILEVLLDLALAGAPPSP